MEGGRGKPIILSPLRSETPQRVTDRMDCLRRKEPGGRLEPQAIRALEMVSMAMVSKFTDEQKLQVALDLLAGKLSHAEVCRKYDISSGYAYKLKDRALEILRQGIGRPANRPDPKCERLEKRVADLEQLAGDQALAIHYLKKNRGLEERSTRCTKNMPSVFAGWPEPSLNRLPQSSDGSEGPAHWLVPGSDDGLSAERQRCDSGCRIWLIIRVTVRSAIDGSGPCCIETACRSTPRPCGGSCVTLAYHVPSSPISASGPNEWRRCGQSIPMKAGRST